MNILFYIMNNFFQYNIVHKNEFSQVRMAELLFTIFEELYVCALFNVYI